MNIYIVNMPLVHISSLRGEVSVPFIFDLSQLVPSYISPDRITKYKIYTSTRIINLSTLTLFTFIQEKSTTALWPSYQYVYIIDTREQRVGADGETTFRGTYSDFLCCRYIAAFLPGICVPALDPVQYLTRWDFSSSLSQSTCPASLVDIVPALWIILRTLSCPLRIEVSCTIGFSSIISRKACFSGFTQQ